MTTRGGTHDPDPFRIDVPLAGPGANSPDRASRILEHARMLITARAKPIFQNKSGDPVLREPLGVIFPFVGRETAIPSAGADHYRRTSRFAFLRFEDGESGNVFVGVAECAGCAFRPKWKRICAKTIGRETKHPQD